MQSRKSLQDKAYEYLKARLWTEPLKRGRSILWQPSQPH